MISQINNVKFLNFLIKIKFLYIIINNKIDTKLKEKLKDFFYKLKKLNKM